MHPAHDVEPLVVAVTHGRSERLLGDDVRQHDVVVGVHGAKALAIERGSVGGVGVAAAGVIGLHRLVGGREGHRLQLHVVGAEEVGKIELGGGALLHADRGVVQLHRRIHLQRLAHQEALAVDNN